MSDPRNEDPATERATGAATVAEENRVAVAANAEKVGILQHP